MSKISQAMLMLDECVGRHGVWASADARYRRQCWTRDFGLATMPLLMSLGRTDDVFTHLQSLESRQRPDGRIPILFLDGTWGVADFVCGRLKRSFRSRSVSFMLRRWAQCQLWNLTPGTRDSELYYCLAALEFERLVGIRPVSARSIHAAVGYIERALMKDGLVRGCDWRDTMHVELDGKALLTNNSVLVRVYDLLNDKEKATTLRRRIRERFWYNGVLRDYPGAMPTNDRPAFDPLGASLAVLYNVVSPDEYPALLTSFRAVDSDCGVTIMCKHNPLNDHEKTIIEETQGVVTWPFVVGFTSLAARHMARNCLTKDVGAACSSFASQQLMKLEHLDGFYEWYDPRTGVGCGAKRQLWSAVLYARAQSESLT